MTRQLADPIEPISVPTQRVISGRYVLAVLLDGSVDLPNSWYEYQVDSYLADGSLQGRASRRVYEPAIPTAFKTKLRDLHNMVISDAEAEGLLGAGADAPDF